MNSAKLGFLLLLCLGTFCNFSVFGQKRVSVTITQETDRGTITIDTTFEANGAVDLDEVIAQLQMEANATEERIVVRSNQGSARTLVVNRPNPNVQRSGEPLMLGVYLDTDNRCDEGIRVSKVTDGGAAQRAGMRNGDILLRLGSYRTNSYDDVVNAKKRLTAEEPIEIEFKRGSARITSVLSFIENGENYSYNYDYDYNYNYNYNEDEEAEQEEHEEQDAQWNWDSSENTSWNYDEEGSSRAFLGVYSEDVDEDMAEELGLPDVYGVYIDGIVDNSAAEAAGLQEGDVIVGFNNDDIPTAEAMRAYLGSLPVGERIRIGYYRDGRLQRTSATLGHTPSEDHSWKPEGRKVKESKPYLGVYLEDARNGVRISRVVDNSAAEDAGLRRGDVIVELNGEDIDDYEDLKEVMQDLHPGQNVRLTYIRDGERERTRVELGAKTVERWEKQP